MSERARCKCSGPHDWCTNVPHYSMSDPRHIQGEVTEWGRSNAMGITYTVCAEPGCDKLTYGYRCLEHAREARRRADKRRPHSRARGYTRRHEKLRKMCLARDPICVLCGERLSTVRDHIVPLSQGGADTLANSQGLCVWCHNSKSARERG